MIRALTIAASMAALYGCSQQKPANPPPQVGRYVIVHSAEVERDTILLDTATGRTWSRVEVSDLTNDPAAWDPMPQLNAPADLAALRGTYPPKESWADLGTPAKPETEAKPNTLIPGRRSATQAGAAKPWEDYRPQK